MTHSKTSRCSHIEDDWQWEVKRGTCCTTDLGKVIKTLKAWGESELASRVRAPVSAEEAAELGWELEIRGTKMRNRDCAEPETRTQHEFAENCHMVCAAGAWYQKLGDAGFGVALSRTLSVTDAPRSKAGVA